MAGRDDEPTVRGTLEELMTPPLEAGKACLIVLRGRAVGRLMELDESELVLGRTGEAELSLEDDGVSRRHARVLKKDETFVISDLGSTNGLFVNGQRVQTHVLVNGDRVQLGPKTLLKFCYQDPVEEAFQKKLYSAATRDVLVGAFNRRYFFEALAAEFAYARRHGAPLALLMLDLDHFKRVNDSYGHLAGDHALKEVARLIQQALRAEDVLARYGGEEFVVLARNAPLSGAIAVAERIRRLVAHHPFEFEGQRFRVTTSLGVAIYDGTNFADTQAVLKAADDLLLLAKAGGRNRTISPEGCVPAPDRAVD